ncbi:MAG: T6SS immunity protein Tdi1 domain-containing protein [Maioricimonas sp. JB049]
MSDLLQTVRDAWGWTGLEPVEAVASNPFGNLLLRDDEDRCWRLCPEDLYCQVIADSTAALEELRKDDAFTRDWEMAAMVMEAEQRLGPLAAGERYCLKIPGVLGGEYTGENLGKVPFDALIRFSGDIAEQIKDLPDGAPIRVRILE